MRTVEGDFFRRTLQVTTEDKWRTERLRNEIQITSSITKQYGENADGGQGLCQNGNQQRQEREERSGLPHIDSEMNEGHLSPGGWEKKLLRR